MNVLVRASCVAAAIVLFAGSTHLLHLRAIDEAAAEFPSDVPLLLLPDADVVRWLSLGQRTTAADLYFLRLVQYVGNAVAADAGWPQLLPLAELITDLDPEFGYAYEASGILLSSKNRAEDSNRILKKGFDAVPQRWQLPFFASYNHWYLLDDLEGGAELLLRAAKIPGSPRYVGHLAARLYSTAGRIDAGLAYVETLLRQEVPDEVRKDLERRRVELHTERDLRRLEEAIAAFVEREGRHPHLLAELVGVELPRLPTPPDGSVYSYDPWTGEVSSHLLPKRLQYSRPADVPNFVAIPR